MVAGTLATAVVQIRVDGLPSVAKAVDGIKAGFARARTAIGSFGDRLKEKFAEASKQVSGLRTALGLAFGAVTGAAISTLPLDMARLGASIQVVAFQVARIFLPVIRQLTRMFDSLASYLARLTDEQRASILGWVKFGAVLASVVAFGPAFLVWAGSALKALSLLTGSPIIAGFTAVAAAIGLVVVQMERLSAAAKEANDAVADAAKSAAQARAGNVSEKDVRLARNNAGLTGDETEDQRQRKIDARIKQLQDRQKGTAKQFDEDNGSFLGAVGDVVGLGDPKDRGDIKKTAADDLLRAEAEIEALKRLKDDKSFKGKAGAKDIATGRQNPTGQPGGGGGRGDFAPALMIRPEFSNISDQFRNAQRRAVEDPNAKLLNAQLKAQEGIVVEQKNTNEILRGIRKNQGLG